MQERIQQLTAELQALTAHSEQEVEDLRIKYISKKGLVSQLFDEFKTVPNEEKRQVGQLLNALKTLATDKINELRASLSSGGDDEGLGIDWSRTAYPTPLGSRHPLTIVQQEICSIFARLGFSIAEGPEIEDDWHVFSALNFAEDHPARDMQDTFFVRNVPGTLLRTPYLLIQTRTMPGVRAPPSVSSAQGRVYRNEAISYRAHCFFHQLEALYVDQNVSFADLKQVLLYFAQEMFGTTRRFASAPLTSPSRSHRQRWISPATSVAVRAVTSVSTRAGLRSSDVVW